MKNVIKIVALALVLVMTMGVLASCGKKLSGKYEATIAGTGTVLEFDGDKVYASFKVNLVITTATFGPVEGTYKIEDDKITLDFVDESKVEDNDTAKERLAALQGEFDFEEGEDTIKIGGVTYTKAE
ncbi:MAG: hypothetical protein E7589_06500 [Ruminococcaceae bacterium]|nr:hypothetical protein [Oscillospiraceae bacterium]